MGINCFRFTNVHAFFREFFLILLLCTVCVYVFSLNVDYYLIFRADNIGDNK